MRPTCSIIVGALIAIVLSLVCIDCSCGKTRYLECTVTGHQYKPPWTEIVTSTDSDGDTSIDTVYHPEEYHVICQEAAEPFSMLDVSTGRGQYYGAPDGKFVTVKTRQGRWTSYHYLPRIVD